MDADYQNLLLEIRNDILTITINRESQLNSLDRLTLAELKRVFSDEAADKHVKGVIITGSGPKAFIAGADINEIKGINDQKDAYAKVSRGQNVIGRIAELKIPTKNSRKKRMIESSCDENNEDGLDIEEGPK